MSLVFFFLKECCVVVWIVLRRAFCCSVSVDFVFRYSYQMYCAPSCPWYLSACCIVRWVSSAFFCCFEVKNSSIYVGRSIICMYLYFFSEFYSLCVLQVIDDDIIAGHWNRLNLFSFFIRSRIESASSITPIRNLKWHSEKKGKMEWKIFSGKIHHFYLLFGNLQEFFFYLVHGCPLICLFLWFIIRLVNALHRLVFTIFRLRVKNRKSDELWTALNNLKVV